MNKLYLGIDTSNYKTSVSVIDSDRNILFNRSEFLDVKQGERGLRQSDAFFMHSNKLPHFVEELFRDIDPTDIKAIGVSTRPRRVEGSYMPCFLAGYNLAREIGAALGIPVYEFSHQEGHAAAILEHNGLIENKQVILGHLSGGTTEFLLCSRDPQGYETQIIGGTKDISIGQLIDRFGVQLGMPFPSGRYLDEMASVSSDIQPTKIIPRIRIDDGYFNLSGIENKLSRFLQEHNEASESDIKSVVSELFNKIALLLTDSADYLREKFSVDDVYLAGGVSSSRTVRNIIDRTYIHFGEAELSGDNAVGVALLAMRR